MKQVPRQRVDYLLYKRQQPILYFTVRLTFWPLLA